MPEPTLDQIAPGGVVQLDNAPGSLDDATFDSLFPAEPSQIVTQPAQQATIAKSDTQLTAQTQTIQQPEFVLAGERSKYKTAEEAVKGINEKDALIEQMRTRYALVTGVDPITGKPVGVNGQPQQAIDYSVQPDLYLTDLYEAAKKGGPEAYRDVQQKFILDTLKPLAPTLQKAARDQAVESLVVEVPGAKGFVGTTNFNKALDANPDLKAAIQTSESDHRFYSRLPGLYKLAYQVSQGLQLPEIIKASTTATQTTQTTQQTQQPVRTTVQPTTTSIAATATQPSFKTIDGIRATIKDMESKGVSLNW